MLSGAQSAECLSDPRSAADAYEIYYATFIAIKSAHRIALSNSPTFSKCALFTVSVVGVSRCASRRSSPVLVVGEIEIASSEDSTTIQGGLSHHYEACIWPTRTKDEAEDEDRETIKEERKEDFAREEDERRDARLSAGREGKRRRLRKGEVGGGYKVTRVQNRARERERERANERVRAVRPA